MHVNNIIHNARIQFSAYCTCNVAFHLCNIQHYTTSCQVSPHNLHVGTCVHCDNMVVFTFHVALSESSTAQGTVLELETSTEQELVKVFNSVMKLEYYLWTQSDITILVYTRRAGVLCLMSAKLQQLLNVLVKDLNEQSILWHDCMYIYFSHLHVEM